MLKYEIAHPGQPVQVTGTAALLYPARLAGDSLVLKDWASSSFYCWDAEHISDYPVRDSGLSTAHLPPEERVFGCGRAAAPGSLAPVAPDWLQPSIPGGIPSPLLLIPKLFTCLPRNISWLHRSLHLCSHPPQAVSGANWQLVWAVSELQRWRHLQTRATGYFEQFLLCLRRPPDPLTLKDWNCHTRAWCANDWCAG